MLELGRKQKLKVVKKVDFGVYLAEDAGALKEEQVLLPARQVPEEAEELIRNYTEKLWQRIGRTFQRPERPRPSWDR